MSTPENQDILHKSAKVLGKMAGAVVSTVSRHHAAETGAENPSTPPGGKLPKKNKSRLPRKQKKALQKTAEKHAASAK